MNRLEFLTRLRNSLEEGGLPTAEIDDALKFYEEVFLDAGFGREEEVAASLGEPEAIARDILLDSGLHADGEPTFMMEEAARPAGGDFSDIDKEKDSGNNGSSNTYQYGYNNNNNANNSNSSGINFGKFLLLVVTFPLWLPIIIVCFALTIAGAAVAFALTVALIAAGAGLIIGGVTTLFTVPPIAIMMIGGGLILWGIFGLFSKPTFKKVLPACASGVRKAVAKVREVLGIGGENNERH